jgi:hypothetical protein
LRARYYDPGLGRFLSQEPQGILFLDSNLYIYGLNDPIELTDPSGFQEQPLQTKAKDCGPKPGQKPRSEAECCKAAKESKDEKLQKLTKLAGAVICCDGRPVPCLWLPGDTKSKTYNEIFNQCRLEHEKLHITQQGVKKCDDKIPSLYPRTFTTELASLKGEQEAWIREIKCLIKSLKKCKELKDKPEKAICIKFLCGGIAGAVKYASNQYKYEPAKEVTKALRDIYRLECSAEL